MFVLMRDTLSTVEGAYLANEVYELPDAIGASWVCAHLAAVSETPPKFFAEYQKRLEDGADKPCFFEPFIGEFGHLIAHARFVHFHSASEKWVCCREGEQVLFPSATGFCTDWPEPYADKDRVATMRSHPVHWHEIAAQFPSCHRVKAGMLSPSQELLQFTLRAPERIPFEPTRRGLQADVCLGVRHRQFCPERNWQHWQTVADTMTAAGHTVAVIGRKDTAPDLAGQTHHSGDYDTAAAVELLQGCRLYIGGDSGNSHLAANVGAPMLIFREEDGGSRDMIPLMEKVNPAKITYLKDRWDKPGEVIAAALSILRGNQ